MGSNPTNPTELIMEEYDVAIVGAGPAGGNCARELAAAGRSVLLVEQSKVIGLPNFSTAGTPNETMRVFGLPKKVTDCPWSSFLIASENEKAEFVFGKRMGYILNYMLLKQFLAKQAEKKGAEVVVGTHVSDVIYRNGKINGIKFNHEGELKEVRAKIVVDASGGRALLSQKLGLMKTDKSYLAVGVEYHMKNIEFERKERMDFYIGPGYAPGGYIWIFPSGGTTAKVGLGILVPTEKKVDAMNTLKKFVETNPQTSNAIKTDVHAGSLFANGGIKDHVLDGFVVIGDAAAQINPLAGEGIRHALYSGRFAAKTIDAAIIKGNVMKKNLAAYNSLWKNYVGNRWKISLWLQKLAFGKATLNQKLSDQFVKAISKYDGETLFEIGFNYRFELCIQGLPTILKSVSSAALRSLMS